MAGAQLGLAAAAFGGRLQRRQQRRGGGGAVVLHLVVEVLYADPESERPRLNNDRPSGTVASSSPLTPTLSAATDPPRFSSTLTPTLSMAADLPKSENSEHGGGSSQIREL
jgi:hypothetical protein